MNDFVHMYRYRLQQEPFGLLEESLKLSEAPCSPIGMASPCDLTVEILAHA